MQMKHIITIVVVLIIGMLSPLAAVSSHRSNESNVSLASDTTKSTKNKVVRIGSQQKIDTTAVQASIVDTTTMVADSLQEISATELQKDSTQIRQGVKTKSALDAVVDFTAKIHFFCDFSTNYRHLRYFRALLSSF